MSWASSSSGRASALQAEGSGFDPRLVHQFTDLAQLGERHPYKMDVVGSNPSVGTTKRVRRRSGRHPIPTTPLAAGQEYKDSAADKTTMINKHARSAVYVVISCLLHLGKVDALQC